MAKTASFLQWARSTWVRAWIVLIPMLLLACSRQQVIEKLTYPEDRALARAALADLESRNAGGIADKVAERTRLRLPLMLPKIYAALPQGVRREVKLVDGRYFERAPGGNMQFRQAYLAYEVTSGSQRALVQLTIIRTIDYAVIGQLMVSRIDRPAEELNGFSLSGKPIGHYAFLLLGLGALAASGAAIFRVWRSGRFRRRWLWTLGCLVGLMKLTLNWSSGQLFFAPISIQLIPMAALKQGLLMPWLVSASIPVFALYVLFKSFRPRAEERALGKTTDRVEPEPSPEVGPERNQESEHGGRK
jgi:hypothetical protein